MEKFYKMVFGKALVKIMMCFQVFTLICGVLMVIGCALETIAGSISSLSNSHAGIFDRIIAGIIAIAFLALVAAVADNISDMSKALKEMNRNCRFSRELIKTIFLSMLFFILVAIPTIILFLNLETAPPKTSQIILSIIVFIDVIYAGFAIKFKSN